MIVEYFYPFVHQLVCKSTNRFVQGRESVKLAIAEDLRKARTMTDTVGIVGTAIANTDDGYRVNAAPLL